MYPDREVRLASQSWRWVRARPLRRIGRQEPGRRVQDSGDLFGRYVIIAARVGAMANGGEILVSSIFCEIASARGDLHFGDSRVMYLTGVGDQIVYPVLCGAELPTA